MEMKTLKSLGVALALAVGTFGFASNVQAQSKEASGYHLVGLNEVMVSVLSGDIASAGTLRKGWVFGYFAQPLRSQDGQVVKAVWVLTEFNCATSASRQVTVEFVSPNGEIIHSTALTEQPTVSEAGSPLALALAVACGLESEAVPLTPAEAMDLLVRYDEAIAG